VREHTILVERSVAFGQLKPTKTGQTRTVRLLGPLADRLAVWRETTPRSSPTDLIFPAPNGSPWDRERTSNWRKRAFAEAAAAAGVPKARPYDLRHSFISLLIAQGATVVEVARQAGHSPTMALSTYAHVFDEFAEVTPTSAEEVIRTARAKMDIQMCPFCVRVRLSFTPPDRKIPANARSPLSDSNRRPLPYHGSALPTELRGRVARRSLWRRAATVRWILERRWRGQDSNLRRLSRQIYSLVPLTAREPRRGPRV